MLLSEAKQIKSVSCWIFKDFYFFLSSLLGNLLQSRESTPRTRLVFVGTKGDRIIQIKSLKLTPMGRAKDIRKTENYSNVSLIIGI